MCSNIVGFSDPESGDSNTRSTEPEIEYNERKRDSGTSFVTFIKKNFLEGKLPKTPFIPRALKEVLAGEEYKNKQLLLFIIPPDKQELATTFQSIEDSPKLQTLLRSFYVTGILSTCSELNVLRSMWPGKPCILALSRTSRQVKVAGMALLDKKITADALHGQLVNFVQANQESVARETAVANQKIAALQRDREYVWIKQSKGGTGAQV